MLAYVLVVFQSLGNGSCIVVKLLKIRDGFPRDRHHEGALEHRQDYDMIPSSELYTQVSLSVLKTE